MFELVQVESLSGLWFSLQMGIIGDLSGSNAFIATVMPRVLFHAYKLHIYKYPHVLAHFAKNLAYRI